MKAEINSNTITINDESYEIVYSQHPVYNFNGEAKVVIIAKREETLFVLETTRIEPSLPEDEDDYFVRKIIKIQ